MNPDTRVKVDRGPMIAGLVFIVVGTFLLLDKLGYLPSGLILHFWPSIFILIGLIKMIVSGGRPIGAAFIALGVFLQLQELHLIRLSFWQLWPVFLIIAGVAMLWQAMAQKGPSSPCRPELDGFYIFGGGERHVNAKDFKNARLLSVFGGYKIDLRHADIDGTQAVIEAFAVFGGGEIIVPENWLVVMQGVGVFGAYEDKTRHFQPDPSKPTKTLYVRGMAVFAGIEIKN
jgi:predicted membrane protein